jgi:CRP-like cAMP-binding protein
MALDDDIMMLTQVPLFKLLEQNALRLIAFAAETKKLQQGEILFQKGDRSDGGYIMVKGAVALSAYHNGSEPIIVAGPGTLIGQSALFHRSERQSYAVAQEASTLMRITPSLMRRVLQEFPDGARAVERALSLDLSHLSQDLSRVRERFLALDALAGSSLSVH